MEVSIHAPARGATSSVTGCLLPNLGFQSTPPHGERPCAGMSLSACTRFQSTPPHGERPQISLHRFSESWSFNPRPRTGSDCKCWKLVRNYLSFNPRPRTGSDLLLEEIENLAVEFQSTPPHGERHWQLCIRCCPRQVSIHAPARGATSNLSSQVL